MKVSYKKLWVMLAEREISKATLRKQAGLSSATFTKLRKNQEVTLAVMLKIADVLNCNAGDMMDFIKDEDISPDASSLDTNFNIRIGWLGVPPVINEVTFDGKTDWLGQY